MKSYKLSNIKKNLVRRLGILETDKVLFPLFNILSDADETLTDEFPSEEV